MATDSQLLVTEQAAFNSNRTMLAYFPTKSPYNNVSRRLLFTMSNRTPLIFVLEQVDELHGHIETPWRELGPGKVDQASELRIRGYKTAWATRGITCMLHLRIMRATGEDKDTGFRLNIYLQVGHSISNYFGWFISTADENLTPEKWWDLKQIDRPKKDYADCVLNKGDTQRLRATCDKLNIEIEMLTDNRSYSTPSMIIRSTP